jgi:hypothetical protein
MSHAAPPSGSATRRPPHCLTCAKPAQVRGLCHTCRSAAWRAVAAGQVTEDMLIASGLLLPPQPRGRKARSGFAGRLAQVIAATERPHWVRHER